ncbi:hypothetical protein Hanom_Chr10g00945691 [Helianthus anomalus]
MLPYNPQPNHHSTNRSGHRGGPNARRGPINHPSPQPSHHTINNIILIPNRSHSAFHSRIQQPNYTHTVPKSPSQTS